MRTTYLQKIDATQTVKKINFGIAANPGFRALKIKPLLGIYQLTQTSTLTPELTYCFSAQSRPESFVAPPGSRRTLVRLIKIPDIDRNLRYDDRFDGASSPPIYVDVTSGTGSNSSTRSTADASNKFDWVTPIKPDLIAAVAPSFLHPMKQIIAPTSSSTKAIK